MFRWIEETGLVRHGTAQPRQGPPLDDTLDASALFHGTAEEGSRSICNVTFRTDDPELDAEFIAYARGRGIEGVKGHRMAGGMRASIYNAVEMESVEALVRCMRDFDKLRAPRSI